MSDVNRRTFVTSSALGLASAALGNTASAAEPGAAHAAASGSTIKINKAAKAVLPDGATADRAAILKQLGLNPNIAPEAWLAIVACGSNASALDTQKLDELIKQGKVDKTKLDVHSIKALQEKEHGG